MYLAGNKLIEELDLNQDNITNYEINEPILQNTFYMFPLRQAKGSNP